MTTKTNKVFTMITRQRSALFLKVFISALLIWLLMRSVGAQSALERMLDVKPMWFAASLGFGFLHIGVGTFRWQAVLRAIEANLALRHVFVFSYIGSFFNQTLPTGVGGDAVRGYLAYRSGLALGLSVNSILLERVATVLGLVVLLAVVTPFGAPDLKEGIWFARGVWVLLGLALAGTACVMLLDRLPMALRRFRIVRALGTLAVDARRALLHPVHAGLVMFWSVLGHVNLSAMVWCLGLGLGVDVSLTDCMLLFPPALLAQTVPISVAGWGVREGAAVALFALAGVSAESALAISMLYGLVMLLISMPGAVFWLTSGGRTIKEAETFAKPC